MCTLAVMSDARLPEHADDPDWAVVGRVLSRTARALTGSADEAEELVQQTIAHLLDRRPDRAAHFGYARRALTRRWLDQQRSLRRRIERMARLGPTTAVTPPGASHAAADEQRDRLRCAIDALPPKQRLAIVLRLIDQLPYPAIAEAMDTSVASVRANLHLARASLRTALGEDEKS